MKNRNKQKYAALAGATLLLTINFWAWSLISPLATGYAKQFALSPLMVSVLVAAPVAIGSLGRIPLGMITDRYGARRIFPWVCVLSAFAVVGLAQVSSRNALLAAAFALGVGGASFAVGVPFVNAWFPKRERGMALGMYAVGNAGTAVSGLLTPRLATFMSQPDVFMLLALLLLVSGVAMGIFGRDAPGWRPAAGSPWTRLKQALAWKLTGRLALLYALTFGAFVALGMYLPVLLNKSYDLTVTDAAARAAGFVLLATASRPLGGWLSDRLSGLVVLRVSFLALAILAVVAAAHPPLAPLGTIAYLALAGVLGVGNGAIFAIIGHRCDTKIMGTVTGLIGAAGGLGGYFPPMVMGLSYELFKSYSVALWLFAIICLCAFFSLRHFFGVSVKY